MFIAGDGNDYTISQELEHPLVDIKILVIYTADGANAIFVDNSSRSQNMQLV